MNRLTAAAAAGLAVILTIILAVFSAGCAGSLSPADPTDPPRSIEEETTTPTGPGLGTFRPELGSPPIDPLQVWANVAKQLDFDPAAGMTFGVDLDYHVSGAVQWFFVQATTGDDREVRVVWPEQQGDSAHAFVETTPTSAIDTNPPYPYTVYSVLSALGAVGPGNIFAKLPAPGDSGHYGMSFPTDVGYMQAYGLTEESPAYLWDGRAFQTADLGDAKYGHQNLYLCITAGSLVFVPEDRRWKPGPESMATTSAYESAGLSYFLIPLDQDAARVEDYFGKAGYLEGITVKDIQLSDDVQGRTLSLTFAGDGSEQAADLFSNLYYGSTSDDGWPAQLNKAGLGLARIRMHFDWGDGTAPEVMDVDIARRSVAGSTRIRSAPPTTAPTPNGVTPQLRIVNAGTVDITGLVVLFPEGTVDFGDVPAGGATEYRDVPGGVYRYAAYSYTLDGEPVLQRVADWVGESPMPGAAFTYRIQFTPTRREGAQIWQVGVTVDRQ